MLYRSRLPHKSVDYMKLKWEQTGLQNIAVPPSLKANNKIQNPRRFAITKRGCPQCAKNNYPTVLPQCICIISNPLDSETNLYTLHLKL